MAYEGKCDALIAVGAAVAANCQACLQTGRSRAIAEGATENEIAGAMEIGQLVRQGAASMMDAFVAGVGRDPAEPMTTGCERGRSAGQTSAGSEGCCIKRFFHAFNGYSVWWLLLVWWGITLAVPALPEGAGLAGTGVIFIGLNILRAVRGDSINGFSTILGIIALAAGGWGIARSWFNLAFPLPVVALAMIIFGLFFLGRQLLRD